MLALAACAADDPASVRPPDRERDVIVTVPERAGHVIYQDGDGPWQAAPRLDADRYGFDVTDGRYGVALVCVDIVVQRIDTVYATVTERADLTLHAKCDA